MDDFPGLMADFGFRPQGKSAPMSASKPSSGSASANPLSFDDIFSGFKDPNPNPSSSSSSSSMPVYDKPVYDDDIFDGVPGMKSSTVYDDVFGSMSKGGRVDEPGTYDDLLGGLGRREENSRGASKRSEDLDGFEELIPGFGGASPPMRREPPDTTQHNSTGPSAKHSATMREDPFVVLEATSASAYPSSGMFTDPIENLGKPMNPGSANVDASPGSEGIFDDIDAFDGLTKSVPSYASEKISRKDQSPQKFGSNGIHERSSVESFDNVEPKTQPTKTFDSSGSFQSPKSNDSPYERNATLHQSPKSFDHLETADDGWLTVSEIPLFTQPTSAPPPSRPPPQLVINSASVGRSESRRMDNESYSQSTASYPYPRGSVQKTSVTPFDELEDFAMGKPQYNEHAEFFSNEDYFETNSTAEASAAAMKEAMDRAEAKLRHAKEVRERERDARSARSREDERTLSDTEDLEDKERQEILEHERLQREREEKEREQRRLEKEREELEREKARQAVERATREARQRAAAEARLRAERAAVGKANAEARQRAERAAVQRAAAEARERAAAEARERAERAAAEARERSAAEARDRAAAEAREMAAAEAREKAARDRAAEARDKAASEARDRAAVGRATAEARLRAGRAAVDRAHAEERERAAAEARERAAAAAREKQNRTENDLESFFSMGARANSAPKQRATTTENIFDAQAQSRGSADGARRTSSTSSSTIRKASSATNIVDDLTSIFGGAQSSGEFQEVEGETEERRRSRLERHQRTLERAAKALAEKNERDMQTQREQAERHRIAETLDMEIKRWASGKEGNLRALLSTLQYVLWPECGWQPVSLTDLITGAAVKKVYRKATLCIHPDKVQQKGATLQQKYIAEKVFDLLKEAWNKLNSEELF